ncbi:hypothetical protein SAMD00019534_089290 [Acytostelium subglobosum LB1]|uniref:hypothetical protein n=1 Tax=Acytostelium subglobosum LB1 TaxID=1410327 RepID=UPI000644D7C6|nr:hypothetical protein SAMD00019534_089290 [Acytostelium subglobosum LB1]GAM25754.1 hypothetical protein SAMD00019534_089290 [Acytostelium subglobosum LB1]|eukprot:XP_012751272.1 hypothetical protein SAMD00019534_089290 [Acytostelium subglobosum LB1]
MMEIGAQVRELGTGALGVVEKGNNVGGWYVNFGARRNWKKATELEIVGKAGEQQFSSPSVTSEEPISMLSINNRPAKARGAINLGKYSTLPSKAYFEAVNAAAPQSAFKPAPVIAPVQPQQQVAPKLAPVPAPAITPPPAAPKPVVQPIPAFNNNVNRSPIQSQQVQPQPQQQIQHVQQQQMPVLAHVAPVTPPTPSTPSHHVQKDMWHIEFKELALEDVIGTGKYGEVSLGTYLGTPCAIKRILECSEDTKIMIEPQACTYLQARGILHRDLKSQNILLTENYRAKLCDLGLARVFEDTVNKRLTFVGSDRWMAPEIFMGQDYDYKVDVFSYGIVLVELITNAVPDERKPQKMFAFESQLFLNKVPPDCPSAFAKLTVACCSTDPKSRPSFNKILEIVRAIYNSIPDDEEEGY